MSKPTRMDQRPVEDVLRGSLADIDAGRMRDFDSFLAEMDEKVRLRIAKIEENNEPHPVVHSGP